MIVMKLRSNLLLITLYNHLYVREYQQKRQKMEQQDYDEHDDEDMSYDEDIDAEEYEHGKIISNIIIPTTTTIITTSTSNHISI